MKKLVAFLLILSLILTLPLCSTAFAEEDDEYIAPTLTVQPPSKLLYYVGEAPDYTGSALIYTDIDEIEYPLANHCTGFDTSTPGNKTVTVRFNDLTTSFTIIVLRKDEPILEMTDIRPEHWAVPYFGPCMKAEYFAGDDQKRLNPDKPITRAEMAMLVYRVWKTDPNVMIENAENASAPFNDVARDAWYYEAIEACRKAGIIRGMDDGGYKPENPITREDAILMLMRIRYTDQELNAVNINQQVASSGINPTDFRSVSNYARSAMALALGTLVFGDDNNAIRPRSPITRAETAALFHHMFLANYSWTAPEFPEVQPDEPIDPPNTGEEGIVYPLVYLSPSGQFENRYAAGNTTEGIQMYRIAEEVKRILLNEGYRVFVAKKDLHYRQRPDQANHMGADLYVPIHSNAGGNVTGTYVFYNETIPGCTEFSREIFDRVAALTGTPYSTSRHKEDYVHLPSYETPFHEVGHPTMPLAYIEVEFHDKVHTANWIINNTKQLARAIADGIIAYSEKHLIKEEK